MKELNECSQEMLDACNEIEGLEIVFGREEIEIYWEMIRLYPKSKDVKKAINLIKELKKLNIDFA
jgi:hypothetical protein